MDWTEILQNLFTLVIIPLLGLATKYLVQFLNVKAEEIKEKTNNETISKYTELLKNTVSECVIATNQTYVEALKNKNAFTKEAQEEALKQTYDKVMTILSDDAKEYAESITGDLKTYVLTLIEQQVNENKK